MLSAPDADLARRDPGIPGLSLVLNPNATVAALSPYLPWSGGARMTYVHYKPGKSCVVDYRLDADGDVEFYAKACRAQARGDARGPNGLRRPGRIILEDGAVCVGVFPVDHKVKTLKHLADAKLRRRLLSKLVPDRPDLWEGTGERLRYLPERRYVARWMSGGRPAAVLKLHAEDEYAHLRGIVRALPASDSYRTARCLGQSDKRRILMYEWLPGRVLADIATDPDPDFGALSSVGAALAHLHAQDPVGLEPLGRETEVSALFRLSASLSFINPQLAGRLDRLVRRLVGVLGSAPPMDRPIHGDFSIGQVLLDGDKVGIVDFDRAAMGDPGADIGMLIASLVRKSLTGAIPANRLEPLTQAFLEGYQSVTRRRLPARIRLYSAVGLLRLAAHPFRFREANWLGQTEAIVGRAAALADDRPARSRKLVPEEGVEPSRGLSLTGP